MSRSTQEQTRQLLLESLFPVAALFIGLFVLIVFIQIRAGVDADQEITVAIPRTLAGDDTVSSDAGSDDDVVPGGADADGVNDPLLASAAALLKRKQWVEAAAIYDSLLAQGATSKLLSAIGLSYFRQGEYHKALDQLNSAIAMRPLHASAYLYRGMTHARMGHNDKALSDYQTLIKLQPYHFEANYNRGLLLLKTNDYESAIATLSHSMTLVGGIKKAKALYALGSAYRKQGKDNVALAMKAFQDAIRIKPDYIEARFGLASLEPDTEEGAARAMAQYKVILGLKPNYSPTYMEMGQRYAQRKDIPAALDAYRKAIQYDSSNSLVHYNFGLFLIAQKRWTEARQQFEEVIRNKPQDSQSHFNLGRVAYGEKSYDLAFREYKVALDIEKGNYPEALLNMGLVYKQQQKYDDSIAMYQSAIKLRGAYPKAWFNTGLAYMKKKDYDKAEMAFRTAISQDAEYEQAWHNLGLIYAKQVRMDEAIKAHQRAIQIRPDYINALMSLAELYKDTRRYSESIVLFNTVLKADDRFASAWHHLGEIYLNQGNLTVAEQSLETALDMGDDGIEIRRDLADLYMKQRNYDKAIAQMESAVNMDVSNPALRLELAQAMKRAGRNEESYAALKKGLSLDPNNTELRKALQTFQR